MAKKRSSEHEKGHEHHKGHYHPLHPTSLGIAGGLLWGLGFALTTAASLRSGYLGNVLGSLKDIYPGYAVSWGGVLSALVFGFVDGFVGLWLLAWLYNKMLCKLNA